MKVSCPVCGQEFVINTLGRKPRNIPVEIFLNALQTDLSGYPRFTETAKKIGELYGIWVDRGLVYTRLRKEAERQGISILELGRKVNELKSSSNGKT